MFGEFKRYIMVTIGAVVCSAAVNAFYLPNQMLSGGVSGVSLILYFMLALPMSITNIIFNIPLFFVAYRMMDKKYIAVSLYGMFIYAFTLDAFRFLADRRLTSDLLAAALCGGIGNGLGAALMYRVNAGTGGTDIIGAILNKLYGVSYGTVSFSINAVIMTVSVFLFGIEPALYTLVAIYVAAHTADKVTAGFDHKKSILIISPAYGPIAAGIVQEVGRGVTFLFGEGAYTRQERKILFVVIKLTQIAKIKAIVYKHDPQAFMIVQEATDVMGKGFTLKSDLEVKKELLEQKKRARLRNIAHIHHQRLKEEEEKASLPEKTPEGS
jgi:uncharacterized membrane-anchored protein YitT (DUF2179 family)